MPFNPDEFLAAKQEKTAPIAFDPDAFLGAAPAPAPTQAPVETNQVSKKESVLRGAAQGATANFGDELTSGVDAAVEKIRELATGKTSLAPGKSLGEKYDAALKQNRSQNAKAEEANPKSYTAGNIAGSLPGAIATGGSSLPGMIGASAGLGALSSLGASEGQTAEQATKEAAKAGAISGGLAALLGGSLKLITKGGQSVLKGPKEAFKLSYDMEKTLSDPRVAQQIGQEIDDVGLKFADLSQQSRAQIGQNLDTIASRTGATINPNNFIKETVAKLDKFDPGRNALGQGAKADLKDMIGKISQDLFKQGDEAGNVSFKTIHDLKQNLGEMIYEQGLYKDNAYVDKVAKSLYKNVSNALKTADGSGEYANLSKVYQTLSSSDPDAFTANALKYLQDPWDSNARGRLGRLLGDLQTMAPDMKERYVPELANFIDQDLQKAAIKMELLKNVGGKTGALALKGIPLPNPSAIASDLGASVGQSALKPLASGISQGANSLRGLIPVSGELATPIGRGLQTVGNSQIGSRMR